MNQRIGSRRMDYKNGIVRRARTVASTGGAITFSLKPIPPFRLDLTVWTLRRRVSNLIDRWDGRTYRRVLALEGRAVETAVIQLGSPKSPRLQVTLTGRQITPDLKRAAVQSLERLLGLR
ncbi:MAG: hypothetical protein ACRED1_08665, partial [Limisphaerales bacterium]